MKELLPSFFMMYLRIRIVAGQSIDIEKSCSKVDNIFSIDQSNLITGYDLLVMPKIMNERH